MYDALFSEVLGYLRGVPKKLCFNFFRGKVVTQLRSTSEKCLHFDLSCVPTFPSQKIQSKGFLGHPVFCVGICEDRFSDLGLVEVYVDHSKVFGDCQG